MFEPTTSLRGKPKIRSAARFIDSTVPASSIVMMPSTAVSTMAFRRTAASRTASSASFFWVMSRAILVNPLSFDPSSKIGASTPLAKKRLPSLRRCQRSSVARPLAAAVAISCSGAPATRSSGGKSTAILREMISDSA